MPAPLDLDQLQTFAAIATTGSFTKAADQVHRTQSAVSMQMRRLEERVGKSLFEKDGRSNRLTDEGERLLTYAQRMLQLNRETLSAFDDTQLKGSIRIGTPDDYADRFLPEIMARFARSNPRVELSVVCEPSLSLDALIARGALDLALVTLSETRRPAEIVRHEPLLWVTSASHSAHKEEVLPMAFGRAGCIWREAAVSRLAEMGRAYRVLVTSWSATAVAAAVLSGLAVSILPECALRPGMRVLTEQDGFGRLPDVRIGILRGSTGDPELVAALSRHIAESLDNISLPAVIEDTTGIDVIGLSQGRSRRARPAQLSPGW